jgi:hypothetical protein
VYAGGNFTTVNGSAPISYLAAFDASGAAIQWDAECNNAVNAVAVSGSTLYTGGEFTSVNGATARNRAAAFDTTNAVATSWNPDCSGSVYTLAIAGTTVFAGGAFTSVNGATPRVYIAALDGTSGTTTPWDAGVVGGPGNSVRAIEVTEQSVYLGGAFTTVNNSTGRNRLAEIDRATGTATAWDPDCDDSVQAIEVSGSAVFIGGDFMAVGTRSTARYAQLGYPAPGVYSISPAVGGQTNTVSIKDLRGANFVAGAIVKIQRQGQADISASNVSVVSSTKISCTLKIPANAFKGYWDVFVRNPDLQEGTLAGGFLVSYPAPTVSSITPAAGMQGKTVTVSNLAGSGFVQGATAALRIDGVGTISARDVVVLSPGRMTCKIQVPLTAQTGSWDVVVRNPDTQEGVVRRGFTVNSAPTPVWYLAEGTTAYGFSTYINIQNPNSSPVTASITYMTKAGAVPRADVTLPAVSQTVINPQGDIGAQGFSTKVVCKEGRTIVVDRRMLWQGPGARSPEGHASVGVTAPAKTWYLPEGSSKWGFETWLLIQNPNDRPANCTITYMTADAGPMPVTVKVDPNSRASFSMAAHIEARDASIKVSADIPVIPERAMYRNNRSEGHDSIGTTTPAKTFYLAEGTTDWGFTTYVLVQNPNGKPNKVKITYMTADGAKPQAPFDMKANSRKTICVNDFLVKKDCSIQVTGSLPLIAERAMYWDKGLGEACHDSIGMSEAHKFFYLPDGETYNGTQTWTLVQNPNPSAVSVQITYMTPDGKGNVSWTETVPASSRKSFNMGDRLPAGRAAIMVACKTAGKKIMVERAMYWNSMGAGTDTIGGFSD